MKAWESAANSHLVAESGKSGVTPFLGQPIGKGAKMASSGGRTAADV